MGIFATASYPFTNTHNSYTEAQRQEGDCTRYCFNRTSYVFGGKPCVTSWGNASGWMQASGATLGTGWVRSYAAPGAGDVAVLMEVGGVQGADWSPGHVLFFETSSIISQSNVRYPGGDRSWNTDVFHAGLFSCVSKTGSEIAGGYLGMNYLGCLHYTGGAPDPGGEEDPDNPPYPDAVWVPGHYEYNTVTSSGGYDYTGSIYECGTGTFGTQSGTQDAPQAPTVIHPGGGRENERWEPFIMYTDERVLTYTSSGQPIWSNWETVYTGSENFQLGLQPAYGNGWEMEWEDDG